MKPTKEQIEHRAVEIMLENHEEECDFCKHHHCCTYLTIECLRELMKTALEQAKKELSKPTLTDDEKVILRNTNKDCKWITRNAFGELSLFLDMPEKGKAQWFGASRTFTVFNHLFQFISWEDEEPYSIEELLGETE